MSEVRFASIRVHLFTLGLATCSMIFAMPRTAVADSGCSTGGPYLANAYALSSPLVIVMDGGLDRYVRQNRSHFGANGDAVRCARALAKALLSQAVGNFDPNYQRDRDRLNTRLGNLGIAPGPSQPSPSAQMFGLARELGWFAEAVVQGANENWAPFLNSGPPERQMAIQATLLQVQMLQLMPEMLEILRPVVGEVTQLTHDLVLGFARNLAARDAPAAPTSIR